MTITPQSPFGLFSIDHLLSEEERAIRDVVREYVDERIKPNVADWFEEGKIPARELAKELGTLGVLGMHLEGYGCQGTSAVAYGLACLELEAGDSGIRSLVSVQGSLAMYAIHAFGSEEQKQEWLPTHGGRRRHRLLRPDRGGLRLQPQRHAHAAPSATATTGSSTARRCGSPTATLPTSRWCGPAPTRASAASSSRRTRPGSRRNEIHKKMSLRASVTSELVFENVRLPADAVLPGVAVAARTALLPQRGAVRHRLRDARRRHATASRPPSPTASTASSSTSRIAGFQLTQKKLADMALELGKGMLLALHLGRLKDEHLIRPEQVSLGKLNNAREALAIARECRSILGGNGITLEYPIIRHMNNLESVFTYEGTNEMHTARRGRGADRHRGVPMSAGARILQSVVDGQAVAGGEERPDLNPSDLSDVVAVASIAGSDVARDAVSAADAAFASWSRTTPWQRAEVLDRAGTEVMARADELGDLLAREEGKTYPEARGEVVRAGQILKYYAGVALQPHGQALDSVRPGIEVTVTREPVGVVSVITPWNFPIAIPAWKIAPALAFGNTVVFKPADLVPGSAWELVDILNRAGLPDGVLNLVLGRGSQVGPVLTGDPRVSAVTFTGSVDTGRGILTSTAGQGVRLQLELGGKNPLVVTGRADLRVAVECAMQGGFGSTGQRCTASSILVVTDDIHDAFVDAMAVRMREWRVGDAALKARTWDRSSTTASSPRTCGTSTSPAPRARTSSAGRPSTPAPPATSCRRRSRWARPSATRSTARRSSAR